jgi:hypothetical protein
MIAGLLAHPDETKSMGLVLQGCATVRMGAQRAYISWMDESLILFTANISSSHITAHQHVVLRFYGLLSCSSPCCRLIRRTACSAPRYATALVGTIVRHSGTSSRPLDTLVAFLSFATGTAIQGGTRSTPGIVIYCFSSSIIDEHIC